jgi:hypothetical protein
LPKSPELFYSLSVIALVFPPGGRFKLSFQEFLNKRRIRPNYGNSGDYGNFGNAVIA